MSTAWIVREDSLSCASNTSDLSSISSVIHLGGLIVDSLIVGLWWQGASSLILSIIAVTLQLYILWLVMACNHQPIALKVVAEVLHLIEFTLLFVVLSLHGTRGNLVLSLHLNLSILHI